VRTSSRAVDPVLLVAADTGGTFTDLLLSEGGRLHSLKLPSTPEDPSRAVIDGLERLLGGRRAEALIHGTTVATNALLERKGARIAFLTTAGFEDVLEIARQDRPELYALEVVRPEPVVSREDRYGVEERTLADGTVEVRPDREALSSLVRRLKEKAYEAVGVGFLHSYAAPDNEEAALAALRSAGLPATGSHEVLREYREYERFTTTSVNVYLLPRMSAYLRALDREAPCGRLRVMQSDGGATSAEHASREPVRAILSGPAGGVVGAFLSARAAGHDRVMTLDMGGTSTDVALCPGRVPTRPDTEIGGLPLRTGVLDLHTVGAGGGSIAWVDAGGALRVGPASAGSDPGPCCYGRGGDRITVSDANLALGILDAETPLAGGFSLRPEAVDGPLAALSRSLGLSPEETAAGVRRVVNASMERALRVISVERGHDPREFTLVAFGGAGPMHAADLAASLDVGRVLVPPGPGVLSAWGMLMADLVRTRTRTVLCGLDAEGEARIEAALQDLTVEVGEDLAGEQADARDAGDVVFEASLDLRYWGQSFELEMEAGPDLAGRFHAAHEQRYGYRDEDRPVEVVTARLRGIAPSPPPVFEARDLGPLDPAPALRGRGRILVPVGRRLRPREVLRYERERLEAGMRIGAPAVVHEDTATTWIPPGWAGRVDGLGGLVLEREGER